MTKKIIDPKKIKTTHDLSGFSAEDILNFLDYQVRSYFILDEDQRATLRYIMMDPRSLRFLRASRHNATKLDRIAYKFERFQQEHTDRDFSRRSGLNISEDGIGGVYQPEFDNYFDIDEQNTIEYSVVSEDKPEGSEGESILDFLNIGRHVTKKRVTESRGDLKRIAGYFPPDLAEIMQRAAEKQEVSLSKVLVDVVADRLRERGPLPPIVLNIPDSMPPEAKKSIQAMADTINDLIEEHLLGPDPES